MDLEQNNLWTDYCTIKRPDGIKLENVKQIKCVWSQNCCYAFYQYFGRTNEILKIDLDKQTVTRIACPSDIGQLVRLFLDENEVLCACFQHRQTKRHTLKRFVISQPDTLMQLAFLSKSVQY
ncbi:hypothetical protein M3Y97_00922300 [Aphelenchoides bicaudatus]|nr:hypothetical protein M3Y97_00922300 [Aphelenchoides bicaudatus]